MHRIMIAVLALVLALGAGTCLLAQQVHTAGDEVCLTITMRDANGNLRRDWNTTGIESSVLLHTPAAHSANTDTSARSWSADPDAFSWSRITVGGVELPRTDADAWLLPAATFDSLGQVRLCLRHSRADTGLVIEVLPQAGAAGMRSTAYAFVAGASADILVDITFATDSAQVYLRRPYEVLLVPRDRFLNPTTDTLLVRATARFPGEFDRSDASGATDLTRGVHMIAGATSLLLSSTMERRAPDATLQWLVVYTDDDPMLTGRSGAFEVLPHPPSRFALASPQHENARQFVQYQCASCTTTFRWHRAEPVDPYTNILVRRDDTERRSDDVRYTVVFTDLAHRVVGARRPANNGARDTTLVIYDDELIGIIWSLAGSHTQQYDLMWYVVASDGDEERVSDGPTAGATPVGWTARFQVSIPHSVDGAGVPDACTLGANHPNPFSGETVLPFTLASSMRVRLAVRDLLGREVALLSDGEMLEGGSHQRVFDAGALPPGVYVATLTAGGKSLHRRLVLR